MTAISNSSPRILYPRIGRFDLLRQIFTEIFIPPAVWHEAVNEGRRRPGAGEIEQASWIQVRDLARPEVAQGFMTFLDPGEAEAIALALESGSSTTVLFDDRKGRRFARQQGRTVVGSAGILLLEKGEAAIASVRPLLEDLRAAGLYLRQTAVDEILAFAGEMNT